MGNIMRESGGADVPAHRVIAAGGKLGGFGGNEQLKRSLLRAEGVSMRGTCVYRFANLRWRAPAGATRPV